MSTKTKGALWAIRNSWRCTFFVTWTSVNIGLTGQHEPDLCQRIRTSWLMTNHKVRLENPVRLVSYSQACRSTSARTAIGFLQYHPLVTINKCTGQWQQIQLDAWFIGIATRHLNSYLKPDLEILSSDINVLVVSSNHGHILTLTE